MPNITGNVANHSELLDKIRTFACGFGTAPTPGYTGTGNGLITHVQPGAAVVAETWTLTCTTGGGHGVGIFSVTGSVSGAKAAATVGTFYGDEPLIEFAILDGSTDFVTSDEFTIVVTEGALRTITQEWEVQRYFSGVVSFLATNLSSPTTAWNGDNSNEVLRGAATDAFFEFEFLVPEELVKYQIGATSGGFDAADMPKDWTIEYSDDYVNWTVADTRTNESGWASSELRTYTFTGAGRHVFWKLDISSNNGGANVSFARFPLTFAGETIGYDDLAQLLLKGTGLAGTDNIYTGYRLHANVAGLKYQLGVIGFSSFLAGNAFTAQPSSSSSANYCPINDGTMTYWIVATGRKIIGIFKISTVFTNFYTGLFYPYAFPSEYTYPLMIAANVNITSIGYNDSNDGYNCIIKPNSGSGTLGACFIKIPDGSWVRFKNSTSGDSDASFWPYSNCSDSAWANGEFEDFRSCPDGSYMIIPVIPHTAEISGIPNPNMYGELDGIFWISGFGNAAENTFVFDSDNFIVFPNITKTLNNDFFAVRLD